MNTPSHSYHHDGGTGLNRRDFLSVLGGVGVGMIPQQSGAQEVQDEIQARLNEMMEKYPQLRELNDGYNANRHNMIESWKRLHESSENSRFSLTENMDEIRIIQKYGQIISILCRNLDLDSSMMTRLILHESKGNMGVESFRGARGLMQIMPDTARDFMIRYPMYRPIFDAISPNIINHLTSPIARDAMRIITQYHKFRGQERITVTREKERAIRTMVFELYNPEVNLIFGHVYFAGLRAQLEPRIGDYQEYLSQYFATLPLEQYRRISLSRRAIGASEVSIEYFRNVYADRLRRESAFALIAEALIQYNGGDKRPPEAHNYAATIQV